MPIFNFSCNSLSISSPTAGDINFKAVLFNMWIFQFQPQQIITNHEGINFNARLISTLFQTTAMLVPFPPQAPSGCRHLTTVASFSLSFFAAFCCTAKISSQEKGKTPGIVPRQVANGIMMLWSFYSASRVIKQSVCLSVCHAKFLLSRKFKRSAP